MKFSKILSSLMAMNGLVQAHPGEDHTAELALRHEYFKRNAGNLAHCAPKLRSTGVTARSVSRRSATVQGLRKKRGLTTKRGEYQVDSGYTIDTDPTVLFSSNSSCALAPEEVVGPYYVEGERIRSDLVEDQQGIPLALDIQFVDSSTCSPIEGAYIDIWSCNSTGVYGGVVARRNGDGTGDPSNLYNSWLRGVQKTDDDGVVQFSTLFPGHYEGRTIHIHTMAHLNARRLSNGTLFDTVAAYVGQIYFDQDLNNRTNNYWPYTSNTQSVTLNDDDGILQADLKAGGNPYAEYSLLGDSLEDGILAWITFGINVTNSETVTPVATYHPALSTGFGN
ncbi:hypothetical protein NLG97_g3423 [Lecanicillium saksenae]|uniref:Uncharacterized protein n=1 Tax=Lecanicillium saksenae TaxID=468837 RepID=A0ACC1QZC6_9HYPO|nr:hypothetical protein NLG97_g3423 [Lecanicillium saksenae]